MAKFQRKALLTWVSLSLSLLCNLSLHSQIVLDTFAYSGPPNAIRSKTINVKPNTQIRFIFCSVTVPDHLDVNLCGQGFSLYIGDKDIDITAEEGFLYYKFEGQGLQLVSFLNQTPKDIVQECEMCEFRKGAVIIDIKVPDFCCEIDWTVSGNWVFPTIYTLKVTELNSGFYETLDTVYSYSCIKAYQQYVYEDCAKTLYIYADSSIQDTPTIINPRCLSPGYIEFKNHPELNQYNLPDGEYYFKISNSVCEKEYEITLKDEYICSYYFPNAFQPSSLNNNIFQLFFDKPLEYTLFIYDRWGSLIYQKDLISESNDGWDGTFRNKMCLPGVYIWRAVVHSDQIYYPYGSVTLVR